jgi:tRNA pseudouridine38-40 synthase
MGEHDFSAFRSSECQAKTPVKTLYEAAIEPRGPFIEFRFRANAFLHHMVRNIVGSLVYVGAGRHSVEEFVRIFASLDRSQAAPTFAPDGLYLAAIEYDESFGLPPFRARWPFSNSL